ncbi:histidine phosphatase family protein [Hyphomicrobium methylovorum]|uniref:histidine phosphatase family protein n=1 Tax=Hyphomicrobium methylovorum TaxID=84 RepID=UPI0015E6722B|nr:histidine phosphatase family protein [Hyphomicrobium methylovorum]MBA2125465.1 histidine phosphatase family protein [Hyphomicrobium methylovorum]
MSLRLTLVCAASTPSLRAPAFPRDDEGLDDRGLQDATSLRQNFTKAASALSSPMRRALDTAAAIGLAATVEPRLQDVDLGRWAGRALAEIQTAEPEALVEWLSDPAANPHGGESMETVCSRVADWMADVASGRGRVVAVTHPAVMRAAIVTAIEAGPASCRRIDIAPLSIVELSYFGGRWVLQALSK